MYLLQTTYICIISVTYLDSEKLELSIGLGQILIELP